MLYPSRSELHVFPIILGCTVLATYEQIQPFFPGVISHRSDTSCTGSSLLLDWRSMLYLFLVPRADLCGLHLLRLLCSDFWLGLAVRISGKGQEEEKKTEIFLPCPAQQSGSDIFTPLMPAGPLSRVGVCGLPSLPSLARRGLKIVATPRHCW